MSTTETPLHELFGALLSERQLSTLENALRVAADRFDEDAKQCRVWGQPEGVRSLGDQFELQAHDTRALIVTLIDGPDEEVECGQCEGTGATLSASNLRTEECPVCDGAGQLPA